MNKLNEKGNKEGLWKEYYTDGQLDIEKNYKDGLLNGLYKSYHENGKLYIECNYIDDKRNGFYKHYYGNGQLACQINHTDDKKNGLYKSYYYKNGQLWGKGHYLMNNQVNLWKQYNKSGLLISKKYYE